MKELLGQGSSRRNFHIGHEENEPVGSISCPRCRWTTVDISWDQDLYHVEIVGHSDVEGEQPRVRQEQTTSPSWVIEVLHRKKQDTGARFLPYPAQKALTEAIDVDDGLREALEKRTANERGV